MKKLFDEIPRIEGDRIVLDALVPSDPDGLQDLMDNEKVYRYLPTFLFEKQYTDAREVIRDVYGSLFANKESLILALRWKETGEFIGLAEFYGYRDDVHKISIGNRFRECFWGRGIASGAVALMLDYLYSETDIDLVTASSRVENHASARVLEKNGFIRTVHGSKEDWGFPEPTIVDKWFH